MQTVDKAMKLLGLFSVSSPEIGLSELARQASFDKAATRRFLVALSHHGLIEQNSETRAYRLGPAFVRYARVREATRPLASIIQPVLETLVHQTKETAHATLAAGFELATIGSAEPQRPTRVSIDPAQTLPLHATASGLAYLAFAPDGTLDAFLKSRKLQRYTQRTAIAAKAVRSLVAEARAAGYGIVRGSFEDEVVGIAAPFFDQAGKAIGTVAVASVASRFTSQSQGQIPALVLHAAAAITRDIGGEPHHSQLTATEGADA